MRHRTRKDHVKDAAEAHTDLVLLAKIAELAEASDLTSDRRKAHKQVTAAQIDRWIAAATRPRRLC